MLFNVCTLYLLLRFTACGSHVLNYDSVTICDGMEKVVRCPNKENIHVLQGFYGKWKNHDCNGIKLDPPGTHTCSKDRQETTNSVRNICQGKNQCTFIADKNIYGDPCPESNAYLYITFFCMAPGKRIEHQKDKNNHEVVTVLTHGFLVSERKHSHPVESQIEKTIVDRTVSEITTSNVENTSPAEEKPTNEKSELERKITIPTASPATDTNSSGEGTSSSETKSANVESVETGAEGLVNRNNIPSEGPDNQTTLDSIERNTNSAVLNYDSVTICDGMEKVVRCPNRENIHVLQGFFGKWKNHDCHGVKIDPTNANTCSQPREETTTAMRRSCTGKNQCTFVADRNLFGDPCPESEPYLYVTFFCLQQGKPIEHERDKDNKEIVTVLSHGYLVSEKKHVTETENPDLTVSELTSNTTPTTEVKGNGKDLLQTKLIIPTAHTGAVEESGSQHAVIVTPVRDERNNIQTANPESNKDEDVEKREEINKEMFRESTICNGQSKLFACLPGDGIKIHSAFYGKKIGEDCNGDLPFKDDTPSCSALDALSNVQEQCDAKQTCLLFADENIYGKSLCPNVNKYLRIEYLCSPMSELANEVAKRKESVASADGAAVSSTSAEPVREGEKNLTVMVCNGERHAISCKRDVGMLILSAFYGKMNGKDCRGEIGYRDDIPDCVNPRALDSVKFLCENRKSCELASEKELFGDDTCPGVNKYLEVSYQC